VTTSMGAVAAEPSGDRMNMLVQFGWPLAIFFFMISAAMALPTPSRIGLDPSASHFGRAAAITEDVRKYMTVLTGINLLVGLGDAVFLWFLGVDNALLWGLLAWFMGYIPRLASSSPLIPPVPSWHTPSTACKPR